jgi:hypothetical protein
MTGISVTHKCNPQKNKYETLPEWLGNYRGTSIMGIMSSVNLYITTFIILVCLLINSGKVSAECTITHNSGSGPEIQTVCFNSTITDITYTTTGATGISNDGVSGANGLPSGVSAHWAFNTITISGTPTESGIFNYSIQLTGGCGMVYAIGTITVYGNFTAGAIFSTGQTICYNGDPGTIGSSTAASGGDGSIIYEWRANSVPVGSSNSATYDPPSGLTANTTYTRWAKDNTCNTTFAQSTGSRVVTVNSPITTAPSIPTGPISICTTATNLQFSVGSVTNATYYDWNIPSGWTVDSGQGTTSITYSSVIPGTFNINVTAKNACPAIFTSGNLSVYVGDYATADAGPDQTICVNDPPITVSGVAGRAADPKFGSWTTSGDGNFSPNPENPQTNYNPGTVDKSSGSVTLTFWTEDSTGPCGKDSDQLILTINPLIANNTIAADQSICTITAPNLLTGSAPTGGNGTYTYLWERSTTGPSSNFSAASGTNNTINYTPPVLKQTRWYRRTVTSGGCSSTTTAIQITVSPVISNNVISSAQCISSGGIPATFTGSAPAGGSGTYTYLWEISTTSDLSGFSAASGTNNTINYNPPALTQTTWYRRTVNSGGCSNISDAIKMTVLSDCTISPESITKCGNDNNPVTLTLLNCSSTAISGWQSSIDAGINWSGIISGTAGLSSFTFQPPVQTTLYRAVIDIGACTDFKTKYAIVNIVPNITPTITPASAVICTGQSVNLTANSNNITPPFTNGSFDTAQPDGWCVDGNCTNAPGARNDNGTPGPWGLSNRYIYNGNTYSGNGKFALVSGLFNSNMTTPVFSLIGIPSAYLSFNFAYFFTGNASGTVSISTDGGTTYSPLRTYNAQNTYYGFTTEYLDLTPYLGQPTVKIKFTFTGTANSFWAIDDVYIPLTSGGGSVPTISYSWSPAAGLYNTALQTVTASPTATTTYTVFTSINGCTLGTANVTVTVNPFPVVTATPPSQSICSGTASSIALTSTIPGSTFSWTAAILTTPTGGTITGFSNGNGSSIAQTLTNTGTTAGVVRYLVTPAANGCSGPVLNVDVTVNPKPVGSASPQTICSGGTTNIGLNSNIGGTTFTWTAAVQNGFVSGYSGCSSSCGTLITQTLTNNGTTPAVLRYTVIPTAGVCAGNPFTVDVTVNPLPTVADAGPDQDLCDVSAATLAGNVPVVGTGAWSIISGTGGSFTTPSSPNSGFTGVQGSSYVLRWSVTIPACGTTSDVVTVTFSQNEAANAGPGQVSCVTGSAQLQATNPVIGSGTWLIVSGPSKDLSQISNVSSPTATFTPVGGTGDYTLRWSVSKGYCRPSTDDITITIVTGNVWHGGWPSSPKDWNTAQNWCGGVPTSSTNAYIPVTGNDPVISSVTSADCKDLFIASGEVLTIESDASASGSFILHGNVTGAGIVTYNRWFLPGRNYITSPPVHVTDFSANNGKLFNSPTNDYNFASYNEEDNIGWEYFTRLDVPLTDSQGYIIKPSGDGIISFSGTLNNSNVTPLVKNDGDFRNGWNAVGNPYTSAIGISVGAPSADYFLNISNINILEPYYSAIYVWNQTGTYDGSQKFWKAICNSGYTPNFEPSWYGGIGSLSDNIVQAGQGFMINAGGTGGVLTFTRNMQYHSSGQELKSAVRSWPGVTLLASAGTSSRGTAIGFNEKMTEGLDKSYDVGLFPDNNFQFYSVLLSGNKDVPLEIQCLPDAHITQLVIPLGLDLPDGGNVTFRATGIILPDGIYPVLEDRLLHFSTSFKSETDKYSVTVPSNTSGTGRFYLHFSSITATITVNEASIKYSAWFGNRKIIIFGTDIQEAKAELLDMNGKKLGLYPMLKEKQNEIPAQGLSTGIYLLHINSAKGTQVIKVPVVYE